MTGAEGGWLRRAGKVAGGVLVVAAVGAAGVGIWLAAAAQPKAASGAMTPVTMGTASITRGTVSERLLVSGTLGFADAYSVVHQGAPGILTAVAVPDTTVSRGGPLYAVANQQIRLLYGTIPAYRDFAAGMSDGPDVRQLEENLVALGMDANRQITVDAQFTAATAAAIRRWQAAWGWPASQRTGRLALGEVVFQPGPLRVSQAQATVGATAEPDQPVLSGTSARPVVTVQLTADRRHLVYVGDHVTVTVTGVASFPGMVAQVGHVASTPSAPGGSGSNPGPSTVPVTITVTVPEGAGDLDQAPVEVAITRQTHQNVLMVPVAALQARPGGGYQVRLDSDEYVPVEPGLFDSVTAMVEVSGNLTVGQRVKVPTR